MGGRCNKIESGLAPFLILDYLSNYAKPDRGQFFPLWEEDSIKMGVTPVFMLHYLSNHAKPDRGQLRTNGRKSGNLRVIFYDRRERTSEASEQTITNKNLPKTLTLRPGHTPPYFNLDIYTLSLFVVYLQRQLSFPTYLYHRLSYNSSSASIHPPPR